VPAEAKIEGDTVVVSSPRSARRFAVRYAWDNYPKAATSITRRASRPLPPTGSMAV